MRLFVAILALSVVSYSTGKAHPIPCGDTGSIRDTLISQYSEKLAFRGSRADGPVELYINSATGSWTIIQSLSNGASCVIAAGQKGTLLMKPGRPT